MKNKIKDLEQEKEYMFGQIQALTTDYCDLNERFRQLKEQNARLLEKLQKQEKSLSCCMCGKLEELEIENIILKDYIHKKEPEITKIKSKVGEVLIDKFID